MATYRSAESAVPPKIATSEITPTKSHYKKQHQQNHNWRGFPAWPTGCAFSVYGREE
jgi:hypothetical protein